MSLLPSSLPVSRIPDPDSAPPLRWGIVAPGGIARSFADALRHHTRQELAAVASRTRSRAEAYAAEFSVGAVHDDYRALVDDPEVDAVYIASPHSEHRDQALLAIGAGKHVLVEKAFTRNAGEAQEVIEAARTAGVTVLEAMWTRFLPGIDVLRQLLADGALGEVSTVTADHGQWFAPDPAHRLFDPDLAGGAVLDLGVYPISFAAMVLGRPDSIAAVGELASTGVDGQVGMLFTVGAAQADLHTSLFARTDTRASVVGDLARVGLAGPFYAPTTLTLTDRDGAELTDDGGPIRDHRALAYEAAHFARLVADGATESPLLPLAETLTIMQTMDEVRRQVGAVRPGEQLD